MEKRVISLEAKVGLFVLAAIILFVWLSFQFGEIKWLRSKGYKVITYMDSVPGLENESPVKMAGVRIGRIEDLRNNTDTRLAEQESKINQLIADMEILKGQTMIATSSAMVAEVATESATSSAICV